MDCSTPGFPVHHQLLELIQTHVHRVGDAIKPSHPLLSPSPPTFNLSQHQGLFQWVSSSHHMAKILQLKLCHQSTSEYSGPFIFLCNGLSQFWEFRAVAGVPGTGKITTHHPSPRPQQQCRTGSTIIVHSTPADIPDIQWHLVYVRVRPGILYRGLLNRSVDSIPMSIFERYV